MATTKDIRDAVKAELSFDPLVDESSITVRQRQAADAAKQERQCGGAAGDGGHT